MLYMFGLNFKIKSAILFNIINLSFFLKKTTTKKKQYQELRWKTHK